MDYCLPHAVLALLQEEDSPQTPKSYFVRSGANSTKITLVYTRRKHRDKTSNASSLASFSAVSSPSSLPTRIDTAVFGQNSTTHEPPGLLRLQERCANKKLRQIQRSASVIGSAHKIKSSSSHREGRKSSLGLSPGGKIARSSFISSRSQHGSSGSSGDTTSSSSTDDYSNAVNHHHNHQQQPQQKDAVPNNTSSINNPHNDRKLNLRGVHEQNFLSNPSNQNNEGKTKVSGIAPNNAAEEHAGEGQCLEHRESPSPQWKASPAADNESCLATTLSGGRRTRSDSHTSRRTCVSTPGRGYGDSARVRGAEDPRTRGFSRAKTDPRRNSVSPRGGMDVCDNFRIFEHSIDDNNEHLTISHSSSPRSDRSSSDFQHRLNQYQQEPQSCPFSGKTCQSETTKRSTSPRHKSAEEGSWACPSPPLNCLRDRPASEDSQTERIGEHQTAPIAINRSPRPPTPNIRTVSTPAPCSTPNHCQSPAPCHSPNYRHSPAPCHSPNYRHSPAPCHSPNYRHSPAPCHSPSRQSTFEYDEDHTHANDHFSPPPTPCLRGCVASEDAAESFNSSVKLRLVAQRDNLMAGRVPRVITPKPCITPPPSTVGLNPPTPAMHYNPPTPAMLYNPPTPAMHYNPSTPAMHHNPSNPSMHYNTSTPAMHYNPSTPAMHYNLSNPSMHYNTSTPAMHYNPPTPAMHYNPPTPAMPFNH